MDKAKIKLRWREGEKAPCVMRRHSDAVQVYNGTVYCRILDYDSLTNDQVYAYHIYYYQVPAVLSLLTIHMKDLLWQSLRVY